MPGASTGVLNMCIEPASTLTANTTSDACVRTFTHQVIETSNILNSTDDANKQVLIGPGLINHGLLEALCAEFAEGIMQEMLQMPTTDGKEIPNYFDANGVKIP
jgi:hypothetical protein